MLEVVDGCFLEYGVRFRGCLFDMIMCVKYIRRGYRVMRIEGCERLFLLGGWRD